MSARSMTTLLARFLEKVDKNGPLPTQRPELGPCWLWTGNTDKTSGYGLIGVGKRESQVGAHRAALFLFKEIPLRGSRSMVGDHLCRNRRCVNPDHLEYVTQRENVRRGAVGAKTECKHGHPYDAKNTGYDALGKRWCRACHTERERVRREARKTAA